MLGPTLVRSICYYYFYYFCLFLIKLNAPSRQAARDPAVANQRAVFWRVSAARQGRRTAFLPSHARLLQPSHRQHRSIIDIAASSTSQRHHSFNDSDSDSDSHLRLSTFTLDILSTYYRLYFSVRRVAHATSPSPPASPPPPPQPPQPPPSIA